MSKPKMICPNCGAEMNHHAMKIDYSVDDPAFIDAVFGGAIKEAHTCPECGHIELRAAWLLNKKSRSTFARGPV